MQKYRLAKANIGGKEPSSQDCKLWTIVLAGDFHGVESAHRVLLTVSDRMENKLFRKLLTLANSK